MPELDSNQQLNQTNNQPPKGLGTALGSFKRLIKDFIQISPVKVFLLFVVNTLNSLASGAGILLIIPLIHSAGIQLGNGPMMPATDVSNWTAKIFTTLGMDASLTNVLSIYLLVIFTIALLGYLGTMMGARLRVQFVDSLRNRIFSSLLYAQWQFLSHERLADFSRMVTGQVQSVGHSAQQFLSLVSRFILILIYLALSLLLSPKLTLIALAFGLFLVAILLPFNKHIYQSGKLELGTYSGIFHSVFEQLSNIKIIKSYSAEQQYLKQMRGASKTLEEQQIKLTRYSALSRLVNLCSAALIFAALFYISISIIDLPVANLIIILFIFSRLMPQLSAIQNNIQQLVHSAPEYLDLTAKVESLATFQEKLPVPESTGAENISDETPAEPPSPPSFESDLTLKELEYSYPNKNTAVFSGLNAQIKKNQTIAICGASGAGKSTLADIIAGLTTQSKGQVLVDGIEINDSNRMAWRSKVAYVTQDVFLFNASIRENLSWVATKPVTDGQLWHCLEMAAAAEYVKALPNGLDTNIGDQGTRLSGGEKQRLALARALLTNPEILILDEATSAIDSKNSEKIKEAILALSGNLTIIVIAHDQSSTRDISNRIELY